MSTRRDDDLHDLTPEEREILDYMVAGQAGKDLHVTPREGRGPAPLSFAQQRLWFIERLEPGLAVYVIPAVLRLDGDLDDGALERALAAIVQRHESLRTRFEEHDGTPFQVAVQNCPFEMAQYDVSGASEAERDERARQRVFEECARGFDLGAPPLIRASLIRIGDRTHLLVLCVHHIAADFVSMGVLLSELRQLYEDFAQGLPSTLTPLPLQYADYAVWQREHLAGDAQSDLLLYWQRQLAGLTPFEMPHPRLEREPSSSTGAECAIGIEPDLRNRLVALSSNADASLFMTFLAALWVLLFRITDQRDIAFGTSVSTRHQTELEPLIGFFVNMLVLRMDLPATVSLTGVLAEARRVALEAYAHQDLPFEKLVEALNPQREVGRTPLFQVLISMHSTTGADPAMTGADESGRKLAMRRVSRPTQSTHFDLELEIVDTPQRLGISVVYNTSLFDRETAERLLSLYVRVLEVMSSTPEVAVSDFELVTGGERERVLREWNATTSAYPRNASIVSLFREQAARRGEATALIFGDVHMSYAELERRSDAVSWRLQELGVRRGELVGLCVERSLEMVVGILGILKSGAAYVPLDPEYPLDRLGYMLSDTGAGVLVTCHGVCDALHGRAAQVLYLDEDTGFEDRAFDVEIDADTLAYVMYTSGSTGVPKGVCVEHRPVVRLVKETNFIDLGEQEVFLQLAPISFDASTLELWGSLLNGGCLVVSPPGTLSLDEIGELLVRHRVSVLWLTSALFNRMVDEQLEALAGVRQVLAGGEALSGSHVRRFLECIPEAGRLVNGYGPTENTTFTCCHVMCRGDEPGTTVPIGRPIANTRVYVLDASRRPVPAGVVGELYAAGDGLARGYLNQEALTREKFVDACLDEEPGVRLYRTGDLVRWRNDGVLEFVGRVDDQVKVRGYRIELGEVESVLGAHPSVREVVVHCREDASGDKRLVAYVVAVPGESVNVPTLRDHLRERLPEYMLPSAWVELAQLPVTAVGKVDRQALPEPVEERQVSQAYEAPCSELEAVIAEAWCELLRVEHVGVNDNFFDLGGHSLLLTRLINHIRSKMGVSLPLKAVFEGPTVRGMARWIESSRVVDQEQKTDDGDREEFVL